MWDKVWKLIDLICLHLGEAQRSEHRGKQVPIHLLANLEKLLEEALEIVKELDV